MKKYHYPVLEPFGGHRGTPQFSKYTLSDYENAFKEALVLAREDISRIEKLADAPTFENTIVALEQAGEALDRVSDVFFNLNHAETSDAMQEIAQQVSPLLSDFSNDIYLNDKLFKRVSNIYSNPEAGLTSEQKMLLEKTYRGFVKNGALLGTAEKEEFRSITSQLSTLGLQFSQNVLAETNDFSLLLTDELDLAGLPDSSVVAAKELAQLHSKEGWMFNLQFPSYLPFMQYAESRELRKQMYMAYAMRCNRNNDRNNTEIVRDIVNLRLRKSQLLGYETYSQMVLADRMANTPEAVNNFLEQLYAYAYPAAKNDAELVQEYAKTNGADFSLKRWDWAFYAERLKEEQFQFTDEMTRPYFELSRVEASVFGLAETLYGISFKQTDAIEPYHPEVRTFEVFDRNGEFLAIFYADFHPRPSKQGGAWMTSFKEQFQWKGADNRPAVSIVCNFTKPTSNKPALLTFSEVETLLHEFGHALHGMLSRCTYRSLSGTSVYRDFVELPSQIMENWATEPEWLSKVACHYETGAPMPADMLDKIVASKNYLSGYQTLRQLSFGMIDMAWHSVTESVVAPVADFETEQLQRTELFPSISGAIFSTSFSHIFGGGYAAGYYGYKWAEVLDADAFEEFRKNGIFHKETAERFRKSTLERGGTSHPMDLYKEFKGKEPSVDALLERSGLKR